MAGYRSAAVTTGRDHSGDGKSTEGEYAAPRHVGAVRDPVCSPGRVQRGSRERGGSAVAHRSTFIRLLRTQMLGAAAAPTGRFCQAASRCGSWISIHATTSE